MDSTVTPVAVHRSSTSLRCRPLADTLAAARRLAPQWCITSCKDATGHDVLGVPVWFSQRGSGAVRRIHSGKGLLPIEAEVGALMEAIELSVAERAGRMFSGETALLDDLVAQFDPSLSVADLAPVVLVSAPGARTLAVATCEDVRTGAVHRMPAELLHQTLPERLAGDAVFSMTSNGLASGNSLEEATLHALLEVLERDAVALDLARPAKQLLAPASLPEPFAEWQARWLKLGFTLRLRVLPSVAGLACIEAALVDHSIRPGPSGLGFGLHPNPGIALARAVTEAAQTRLYQMQFEKPPRRELARAAVAASAQASALEHTELAFADLPSTPCGSVHEALADVVSRLRARGLSWVLRRQLNQAPDASDLDGLHVVKVLVPGCESITGDAVRIGRRLARRLTGVD